MELWDFPARAGKRPGPFVELVNFYHPTFLLLFHKRVVKLYGNILLIALIFMMIPFLSFVFFVFNFGGNPSIQVGNHRIQEANRSTLGIPKIEVVSYKGFYEQIVAASEVSVFHQYSIPFDQDKILYLSEEKHQYKIGFLIKHDTLDEFFIKKFN